MTNEIKREVVSETKFRFCYAYAHIDKGLEHYQDTYYYAQVLIALDEKYKVNTIAELYNLIKLEEV